MALFIIHLSKDTTTSKTSNSLSLSAPFPQLSSFLLCSFLLFLLILFLPLRLPHPTLSVLIPHPPPPPTPTHTHARTHTQPFFAGMQQSLPPSQSLFLSILSFPPFFTSLFMSVLNPLPLYHPPHVVDGKGSSMQ